ncbi:Ldh family oxidoreductase [Dehalococcoidia bacterium]|nr:Ldh family oxidoreductase [Dehalococcoidia bacterium]
MPIFTHSYLHKLVFHVLRAAGANEEESEIIASHSVGANLAGHDSHGVIQIPTYVDRIKVGHIVPGASIEVLDETPSTARIDGHWGFGYVVSTRAMELAIQKARETNVAALTIFRQSHVGRVADYPLMAAREGFIGIMTADSGRGPKSVVPFGGRERRLGTNPICIAFPSDLDGSLFIDMATSAVAAGKVDLARSRKESIPYGWVVDKNGNPTTDPNVYIQGGSILPLGADQGHKGSGLSVAVEIFSGILTGLGFGASTTGIHNDGCLMLVLNVEAFRPLKSFKREVTEFAKYINSTSPAPGYDRVYYPGELEHLTKQRRLQEGIYIEDATWDRLQGLVKEYRLQEKVGGVW